MSENEKKESVFDRLSQIDCSQHVETIRNKSKKTGRVTTLKYLSWAWAWAMLNQQYPGSTYKVYKDEHGWLYHTDGRTAWVEVGVTVEGLEYIECLPVMDNWHNAIPLGQVNSFNVNTAIQRALTKAIARHGLGLSLYVGEDIPPSDGGTEEPGSQPKVKERPEPKPPQKMDWSGGDGPKPGDPPADPHYWAKQCVKLWKSKGYGREALIEVFHFTPSTTEEQYKHAYAQIRDDNY